MNRLRTNPLPVLQLRDALRSPLDALPDTELLDRFARYADHPAFDALLRRHGAMVFGVCRRALANAADADDAFQATFLVFIRKARSLRGERLGPWLYGVAWRVALKARARATRLAEYRTEATDMIPDPTVPAEIPDWLPILDAELAALPAKYRDALVMCELQGVARADAAKALGLREGTLSSRLSRGRELLRKRLLKHGTLLPVGGLAALFTANSVGRATVPVALFSQTLELARVVTGATAGTVPVGAARLTDEVLKSMFLTKLRITGGALVALVLVAVGLTTTWAADAPTAPVEEKRIVPPDAKAPVAKSQPGDKKPVANGPKLSDRDALQGLWVVERFDVSGKGANEHIPKEAADKRQMLIVGDVWWGIFGGPNGNITPKTAVLDPNKNPKWLDWRGAGTNDSPEFMRCIYELNGDVLRVCMSADNDYLVRPAEFATDSDAPLSVITFRREKLPPSAGEKGLVGSWDNATSESAGEGNGKSPRIPTQRIEILDGYLFAYSTEKGRGHEWLGGKYTVDATKNPKWVEVELSTPVGSGQITKLYGCYEVADGRLRMALGTKRATRPVEFTAVPNVLFFDLKVAKNPLGVVEKVVRETVAKPKDAPNDLGENEPIRKLMRAGDFAAAEKLLRHRLPDRTGLDAAEDQLLLGMCVVERARSTKPAEAPKLYDEAWTLFGKAHEEAKRPVVANERTEWIKAQAGIRGLQVLQHRQKPDHLLTAATALLDKHRGTVEELILLSLVYHAHRQKQDLDKVLATRAKMKELFERLPVGAFTAEKGEYSREYWENQWFAEK